MLDDLAPVVRRFVERLVPGPGKGDLDGGKGPVLSRCFYEIVDLDRRAVLVVALADELARADDSEPVLGRVFVDADRLLERDSVPGGVHAEEALRPAAGGRRLDLDLGIGNERGSVLRSEHLETGL